jgi:CheY-like chemotaxis protein
MVTAAERQVLATLAANMRTMLILRGFEERKALTEVLKGAGVRTVMDVDSLDEAVDRMRYMTYRLAIMDDGLDGGAAALAEALRTDEGRFAPCFIVALCRRMNSSRIEVLRAANIGDIIVAPFTPDRLMRSIMAAAFG